MYSLLSGLRSSYIAIRKVPSELEVAPLKTAFTSYIATYKCFLFPGREAYKKGRFAKLFGEGSET